MDCAAGLEPGAVYATPQSCWPRAAAAPIDSSALRELLLRGAFPDCADAYPGLHLLPF